MNHVLATLALRAQLVPAAEGDLDDDGYWTTTNWLIPEQAELIYGGLASVIIIGLLIWKAGPAAKKAFVAPHGARRRGARRGSRSPGQRRGRGDPRACRAG